MSTDTLVEKQKADVLWAIEVIGRPDSCKARGTYVGVDWCDLPPADEKPEACALGELMLDGMGLTILKAEFDDFLNSEWEEHMNSPYYNPEDPEEDWSCDEVSANWSEDGISELAVAFLTRDHNFPYIFMDNIISLNDLLYDADVRKNALLEYLQGLYSMLDDGQELDDYKCESMYASVINRYREMGIGYGV